MVIELSVGGLVTLLGLPTAITAFCFWLLQQRITKRDKAQEERERAREKNEVLIIKGVGAAIALGEATAEAVIGQGKAVTAAVNIKDLTLVG